MSLQPLPLSPNLAMCSELLPPAKGFVFPLLFPAQDAQPQNNRGRKGRCPGPRVPAGSQVRVELRDPLWKVLGSPFPFPGDVAGLGHGKGDLGSLCVCLAGLSCPWSLSWGWWSPQTPGIALLGGERGPAGGSDPLHCFILTL